LSVTLHEPFPILGRTSGENPIVLAIRQAWRNFVGFVAWTIASLGVLIPVAAILAALVLVFRRVRRRTTPV
jgi:Flp pilus assembly protein TadB